MKEKKRKVNDPVSYIRDHLDKSDSELARITGETEFFVKCVREVKENPALQRGGKANKEWKERDRKLQRAT